MSLRNIPIGVGEPVSSNWRLLVDGDASNVLDGPAQQPLLGLAVLRDPAPKVSARGSTLVECMW